MRSHSCALANMTAGLRMQAALVSLLSCEGSQVPCVKQKVQSSWRRCAQLSEQIWDHVSGPLMHAQCVRRESLGQQHLPIPSCKLQQSELTELVDFLAATVREIEKVERLVAAAESITRRLPACPDVASELLGACIGVCPEGSCSSRFHDAQVWLLFHRISTDGMSTRMKSCMPKACTGLEYSCMM